MTKKTKAVTENTDSKEQTSEFTEAVGKAQKGVAQGAKNAAGRSLPHTPEQDPRRQMPDGSRLRSQD